MSSGFVSAAAHNSTGGFVTSGQKAARAGRVPHRVPCRVKLYDPESGRPIAVIGQTINLSRRGLAVQLSRDVPAGTWVEALLPHLNGNPMFFCGTVAHSRRVLADAYEIGIEFAGQTPPAVF